MSASGGMVERGPSRLALSSIARIGGQAHTRTDATSTMSDQFSCTKSTLASKRTQDKQVPLSSDLDNDTLGEVSEDEAYKLANQRDWSNRHA